MTGSYYAVLREIHSSSTYNQLQKHILIGLYNNISEEKATVEQVRYLITQT